MKRSLSFGLSIATLAACAGDTLGGMTERGSRICDSSRVALVGIDANYTLTDNNDKLIYCAAVTDSNCDSRTDEGLQVSGSCRGERSTRTPDLDIFCAVCRLACKETRYIEQFGLTPVVP